MLSQASLNMYLGKYVLNKISEFPFIPIRIYFLRTRFAWQGYYMCSFFTKLKKEKVYEKRLDGSVQNGNTSFSQAVGSWWLILLLYTFATFAIFYNKYAFLWKQKDKHV